MLVNNPLSWILLTAVPCSGLRAPRDFATLDIAGLLAPRDACSDAFGDDASNSICAPSNTLCCVRRAERYPSCQQYLEKGWCCVGDGESDNCYVDQASSCDEPNSVPCNDLADGETEACCPRLTSCQPGFEASEGLVRCNILYGDLVRAAAESKTTSAPSSTQSRTSSRLSTKPTTAPNEDSESQTTQSSPPSNTGNPPPDDSGSQLSGGAIGGIAVAATLVFVAALFGAYKLYKRRKRKNLSAQTPPNPPPNPQSAFSPKPPYYDDNGQIVYEPVEPVHPYGFPPPTELMATHQPAELYGSR